jgi:flagellar protein FlaI
MSDESTDDVGARSIDDGIDDAAALLETDDLPPPEDVTESQSAVRGEILDDVRASLVHDPPIERTELLPFVGGFVPDEVPSIFERLTDTLRRSGSRELPSEERLATYVEEFVEDEWFDFGYLDQYEEVDRQWVNEPFAYSSTVYDPDHRIYRYYVNEPQLSPFERYVREDLTRVLRNSLMYEDLPAAADRRAVFTEKLREVLAEHAANVELGTIYKLIYYFTRDFIDFGRIDPLMRDPEIEDISCDGVETPVFIYHRNYRDLRTNIEFDSNQLGSLIVRLAQRSGKYISISNPLVDASLPDGSRIQLTLGSDISTRGSNFTIRKFTDVPHTPVDLINWNTFDVDQMAYLWMAMENNMSALFAGGTGSGKTTSLNAASLFIPPDSKIVSIEDTREMTLPHENWIQSITRESVTTTGEGEVTTYDLLQAALRQRPEFIVVGEMRTEQRVALTFFQAIGTGHAGYSTFHADSVRAAMSRLQNPPLSVPTQMIRNLDVVLTQRMVFESDRRVRRADEITELVETDDSGEVGTNVVFRWDPETDTHERVNDSVVLDEIAEQRGWSDDDLAEELAVRREILDYLVVNEIADYHSVTTTIQAFARNPDEVLDRIRAGEFDPASFGVGSR